MTWRGLVWPVILGGAFAAMLVVQTAIRAKQASVDPMLAPGSYVSAKPDGAKAMRLLLQSNGIRTQKWGLSFLQLRAQRGAMIVLDPLESPSAEEVSRLKEWVGRGNVALVPLDCYDGSWKLEARHPPTRAEGVLDGRPMQLAGLTSVLRDGPDKEVALRDVRGGAVLLKIPQGEGVLYVLSDPALLSNERIGVAENAALVNLLDHPARTVFFDEFHLGSPSPTSPLDALPEPVRFAFWCVVVLTVLAVLKHGSRFGGIRKEPPPVPLRSGAELAIALGGLMKRAKATQLAANQLETTFRARHGLAAGSDIAPSLEGLGIRDESLVSRLAALERAVVSPRPDTNDLVSFARLLSECSARIAAARGGRPSKLGQKK